MEDPCEICFFKYRCSQICPDGSEYIILRARLENSPRDFEKLKKELANLYNDIDEIPPEVVKQRKPKKVNLFRKPLTFWNKVSQAVFNYINKLTSVLEKI